MGREGVVAPEDRTGSGQRSGGGERAPVDPRFEEVYAAAYDRMVRLARLTSADSVPADEIVQEAFVQLYRAWPRVENPVGYLRTAVLNGCRSWGRRRMVARRHHYQPLGWAVLDGDAIAVRQALRVLSPRQRAAVVLRYFEDLPEVEIATVLGCRPGTVKSLLSRSMPKLRGALDDG